MPSQPKLPDYSETGTVTRTIINPAETTTVEQRVDWALNRVRSLTRKAEELTRELKTLNSILRAEAYEVVDDGRRVKSWGDSKDDWRKLGEALAQIKTDEAANPA